MGQRFVRLLVRSLGQRVARLVTNAVVRWPRSWPLFRRVFKGLFDQVAPVWDRMVRPGHLAALEAALAALDASPRRILDLGTGIGSAAVALAERYPQAEVVGIDLSPAMVQRAHELLPGELTARVHFEVADAAALPFGDDTFDLVTLVNAIPFFDELERVVAPGGTVVFCFSRAEETPIFIPLEHLQAELGKRGFGETRTFRAGDGLALLASLARLD
jgi:ubiquinone/menaquinone biosynthesis C-methylase UbiE